MRNDSLEREAEETVSRFHMLERTEAVLVGLSGGADSVALTHCLKFKWGLRVAACHVNHNLRGEESARDEDFVRELCRMWEIPVFVESEDVAALAKEKGLTLEEAGRQVRYRAFVRAARRCGASRVVTAHTASDNLETVLFNLIRGTGLRGLCGIPPMRTLPPEREGEAPITVIRPLLGCSRGQVEDYCRENGLSYVIDSSNEETDYSRNKLRLLAVPLLREINPDVAGTVSHTVRVLREEDALLDRMAHTVLEKSRLPDGGLSCDLLRREEPPLARRALGLFLEACGVAVNGGLLDEAMEMAMAGTGKRTLSPGRYLLSRGGRLWVETPPDPVPYFETLWDGSWPVEARVPGGILTGRVCRREALPPAQKIYKNLLYLALDYDKIKGKILVRQRRTGDTVALFGRCGAKSLKKLFIERKHTAYEKSVIPVLSDEEGVIALWGIGVAGRVSPDEGTSRLLLVALKGA